MSSLAWTVTLERARYRVPFRIARATLTQALNMVVTVTEDGKTGRGEAEAHEHDPRAAEGTVAETRALLQEMTSDEAMGPVSSLPCGPARNAIDCALWDLNAQKTGRSVGALLNLMVPASLPISGTVSLGSPEAMAAEAAAKSAESEVIKAKLGSRDGLDGARLAAVRAACPDHALIVDANGGWDVAELNRMGPHLLAARVALLEQPLAPGHDHALAAVTCPVLLCADESVTDCASLATLSPAYGAINIKLDKCGGLSEALRLVAACAPRELRYMVGSNGGTSLAAAPAYLIGRDALFVDIDSPTQLEQDQPEGMRYANGRVYAPSAALWGAPR